MHHLAIWYPPLAVWSKTLRARILTNPDPHRPAGHCERPRCMAGHWFRRSDRPVTATVHTGTPYDGRLAVASYPPATPDPTFDQKRRPIAEAVITGASDQQPAGEVFARAYDELGQFELRTHRVRSARHLAISSRRLTNDSLLSSSGSSPRISCSTASRK